MAPRPLLDSTGFLLARVGAESRRRFGQMLARWDLRPSHFAMLMMLGEVEMASQRQLGEMMGVDPRNLVGVVDLLEGRGLLERTADPSDRRRHAVRMTPQGVDLLSRLREAGGQLEDEMLSDLDPEERSVLHRSLLKLMPKVAGKRLE